MRCSRILKQTVYGDEAKFGGGKPLLGLSCLFQMYHLGKTIREGMGQATNRSYLEALDLVITNTLIIDWSGIYKV